MNKIALRRHRLAQVLQVLEPPLQDDVPLQVLELLNPAEDFALRPFRLCGLNGVLVGGRVLGQERVLLAQLAEVHIFDLQIKHQS